MITVVFKQKVEIARSTEEFCFVEQIEIVVSNLRFNKTALTELKGRQGNQLQELLWQEILQKTPGFIRITPGFSQQLVIWIDAIVHRFCLSLILACITRFCISNCQETN